MRSAGHRPGAEARERLLQAAERLFAEKGYAATSVQEITDAAGVNKALLYYYFADKPRIYASLVEDGITAFSDVVDGALASPGSYADRLRLLIHRHVGLLWQRPNLLRMVQRSQTTGEVRDTDLRQRFQEPMRRLEAFFAAAAAAGEFREMDTRMAALSLLALDTGFAGYQVYAVSEFTAEEVAEHVSRLLLCGLLKRAD